METQSNPDLAAILRLLKNPSHATQQQHSVPAPAKPAPVPAPAEWVFTTPRPHTPVDRATAVGDPRRRPAATVADASKITTWTAAQKYVIDNIYSNQGLASKIKQLIRSQHAKERQCWADREALVTKHKGRTEKEKQVAAMLKSMGGIAPSTKPVNVEEDQVELHNCDRRIHAAMTKMATEIDRELRGMGVPFYAIKHELVILEEGPNRAGISGRLDKGELRELQKRVLQLLEELFKE